MSLYIKDLLAFNGIAFVIALVLFGFGRTIMDAVFLAFLSLCAVLLVGGGALGFLYASVSFDTLYKYFRRGQGKKEDEEEETERKKPPKKRWEEGRRGEVNMGKRMVITGAVLLGESLLFSLFLFI